MARVPSRAIPPSSSLLVHLEVATLLAITGAAALVQEVVWTRWLTLALGSSTRASLVVLATFMGGLGVGSYIGGRLADSRPRFCLHLFAGVEALVGLISLALIPILRWWLPDWAVALARLSGADTLPMPFRVVVAAAFLLPPTIPMGATLPLLARWVVGTGSAPGRGIGRLYAFNTLGAAAGPLLAAFFLIDTLGLTGAVVISALADIIVAVAAFALASRLQAEPRRDSPGRESASVAPELTLPASLLAAASLGFLVSGLVGMGLEVAFLRILSVLAGSSVYAFSVMLAAFLLGIAGGSTGASYLADRGARGL